MNVSRCQATQQLSIGFASVWPGSTWYCCQTPQHSRYSSTIIDRHTIIGAILATTISYLLPSATQANTPALTEKGAALYTAHCSVCHQTDGTGIPGVHPPLVQTGWVLGSKERLINVVLNGLEEPIVVHGERYDSVMPNFAHLSDNNIAALLSYIRNSFGHSASAVSTEEVNRVRAGKSLNETVIDFSATKQITDYKARKKANMSKRVQSRVGSYFEKGQLYMHTLSVPENFTIEVFAKGLNNPRSMTLGDKGTIFVGSRRNDRDYIYAVRDNNADGKADSIVQITRGLKWNPMGVAMRGSDLYVGEIDRIVKYTDIENNLHNIPEPKLVFTYPPVKKHGDKYIRFGPDDKLYVPVGAPCNSCVEINPVFASITRINPDGTGFEVYANGVRNSRGYDWHPQTGELWFSDNGRDLLGDDTPPCEINIAPQSGMHFGFPYCHGTDIVDPQLGDAQSCNKFTATTYNLPAHVSPVSLKFYTGNLFPEKYRNQIFISEHGSWNRMQKQGYQVSLLTLNGNKVVKYEPFIEGWLDKEKNDAWGRPADILQLADGSLLLSDDYAGVIYRIAYQMPATTSRGSSLRPY